MEEKPPVVRNLILDGMLAFSHIFDIVKTVWPKAVEVGRQRIYMDAEVEQDWQKPYPQIPEGKDISMLSFNRIELGSEWASIVSFHSCDKKHVIPIITAIMEKAPFQ